MCKDVGEYLEPRSVHVSSKPIWLFFIFYIFALFIFSLTFSHFSLLFPYYILNYFWILVIPFLYQGNPCAQCKEYVSTEWG